MVQYGLFSILNLTGISYIEKVNTKIQWKWQFQIYLPNLVAFLQACLLKTCSKIESICHKIRKNCCWINRLVFMNLWNNLKVFTQMIGELISHTGGQFCRKLYGQEPLITASFDIHLKILKKLFVMLKFPILHELGWNGFKIFPQIWWVNIWNSQANYS